MSESLEDTRLRLTQFALEQNPDADIAPGTALNELIIKFAATLHNPIKNDLDDLHQASAIKDVLDSSTDTYSDVIDKVASNYNLTRDSGTKSIGKLKLVLSDKTAFTFRAGYMFTQPVLNLNYIVPSTYVITTTPVNDNDIEMKLDNGKYYAIIPVEAEKSGTEYQVADRTSFVIAEGSVALRNFVEAKAYGNFTSGRAKETDKTLISRLYTGLANRTLLTEASIKSRLTEGYPEFVDVSVVGANDPEMTRSKQNLFGISTLGMVDVYVRTSQGVETTTITKTATKQDDGTWLISLNYEDVPGFYRVISLLPTGSQDSGSLLFTPTYGYSTANLDTINVVNNVYEARFSKYQTCELSFSYSSTESSLDFDLLCSYQPLIGELQDLFLTSDERIICADYLVKAALPCYVTVNLKVHRKNSTIELPVDKIKQDIYNYINGLKFGEELHASAIVDICHNYDVRYVELPIKLSGEIYTNRSTLIKITNSDVLTIPSKINYGVSDKTTIFVCDYFRNSDDNRLSDAINIEVD